jgi:vacuolar-type H+-ATPase subunit H
VAELRKKAWAELERLQDEMLDEARQEVERLRTEARETRGQRESKPDIVLPEEPTILPSVPEPRP